MPSVVASRRAAALSPIARMAAGGGPTQRMPAASTASAKAAFSARKPKPGVEGVGAGGARGRDDRLDVEEVEGARARRLPATVDPDPSASQVRRIRRAISPRLATKRCAIGRASAASGPDARIGIAPSAAAADRDERV